MTRSEARELATRFHIPLDIQFHALRSEVVELIIAAADTRR